MHSTALLCIRLQLHFVFVSFFCILCAFNACFIPYLLHSKTPLHSQRIWPLLHFYADAFNMHSHSSGHVCMLDTHHAPQCIRRFTHSRAFRCILRQLHSPCDTYAYMRVHAIVRCILYPCCRRVHSQIGAFRCIHDTFGYIIHALRRLMHASRIHVHSASCKRLQHPEPRLDITRHDPDISPTPRHSPT